MDSYKSKQEEEKIKRKAKRYALLLLLFLIALLVFPFFSGKLKTAQRENKVITVKFEDDFKETASSAKKSSARPSARAEEEKAQEEEPAETNPEPEVEPEPKPEKRPVRKLEPTPLTKAQDRPLLTSPEPNLALPALIGKISERAKVKEVSQEVIEVTEEVSEDFMKEIANVFKKSKKSSSSGKSKSSSSGQKSDAGEGDAGSSDSGDASSDGEGESGDEGNSFDGDGLLTRKVIKRANLAGLIKESGKIVINLCVNRDGKVIYSVADADRSTIVNKALLVKAENTAANYRYEKDYTVAEKQCGKLSFIVKIQE